jgi:hypothetical protein
MNSGVAMQRSHVVITGTGRAGTSLLVQLLTNLDLDTSYDKAHMNLDDHCKAGLERDILDDNAPYIVKSPWFCHFVDKVLARPEIRIRHVFIPMRDLYAAAESRRRVTSEFLSKLSADRRAEVEPNDIMGGLMHTKNPKEQESVLLWQLYKLLLSLSKTSIPVTLLHYPRITTDAHYLYVKLKPILGAIAFETFAQVHALTVRPEWVSQFGDNDR